MDIYKQRSRDRYRLCKVGVISERHISRDLLAIFLGCLTRVHFLALSLTHLTNSMIPFGFTHWTIGSFVLVAVEFNPILKLHDGRQIEDKKEWASCTNSFRFLTTVH